MSAFRQALAALAADAGLPLGGGRLDKMEAYFTLLEEANRTFNLTKVIDPEDAALRHFMDSLALPALDLIDAGARVIDVGTGAGFPGLPIAILRDSVQVVLLDSMKKRTAFLASVADALELKNVEVVTARAEDYARSPARERFDFALSRAVAQLNVLLEYTMPFVRVGGAVLSWKGPAAPEEIAAAAKACRVLGGSPSKAHGYTLAGREEFFIVETKKIRPTPLNFPRKAGKPSSEPLA